MKRFGLLLVILEAGLVVTAHAQTPPAVTQNPAVERQRIGLERSALERDFDVEKARCHQRFFVNNCLHNVSEWRRGALAGLRIQEIALNDQERKARAAAKLVALDKKQAARGAPAEPVPDAAPGVPFKAESVVRDLPSPNPAEISSLPARSGAVRSVQKDKPTRYKTNGEAARSSAEAAQERGLAQRQKKAEERREANEQERRTRTKPAALPLPTPP